MTVAPGKYPGGLTIYQGATFDKTFFWHTGDASSPLVDLTGYTAKVEFRTSADAPDPAMLSLSSPSNGITLGGAAGTIAIKATPTQTAAMKQDGVWDLLLTDSSGDKTRLVEGTFALDKGVSR